MSLILWLPGIPVGGAVLEAGQAHADGQQGQQDQPEVEQNLVSLGMSS
jgi:hypothetical protein